MYDIKGHAVLRDFFCGGIQNHLHSAVQEPVCSLTLRCTCARQGSHLSPGTRAPVLHALQTGGSLARGAAVRDGGALPPLEAWICDAWSIVDPVITHWEAKTAPDLPLYPAGRWGPRTAEAFLARDGWAWHIA